MGELKEGDNEAFLDDELDESMHDDDRISTQERALDAVNTMVTRSTARNHDNAVI